MPNLKSAKRRVKKIEKRTKRNRWWRERVKELRKAVKKALEAKNVEEVEKYLRQFKSVVDRAVRKGVLHRNESARLKSRIEKKVIQFLNSIKTT